MELAPHVSYSQAASVMRCARAWWLHYEAGVNAPASPAMLGGSAVDEYVTAYLVGRPVPYLPDASVAEDAQALVDYARGLSVAAVQPRLELSVAGVGSPVVGYPDVILSDGTILDWKRSARWNESWPTQLSVYHLLQGNSEGLCRVVRVWKGKVVALDFEADVPAAAQFLRDAWQKMQQPYHPAEPGAQCGWCSYREECALVSALEALV